MDVIYVIPGFPRRTESFITREVQSLNTYTDVDVHVFAFEGDGDVENPVSNRTLYFPDRAFPRIRCLPESLRHPSNLINLVRDGFNPGLRRVLQGFYMAGFMRRVIRRRSLEPVALVHHWIHLTADSAMVSAHLLDLPLVYSAHARDIYCSDQERLRQRLNAAELILTETHYNKDHLDKLVDPTDTSKIVAHHSCVPGDSFEGLTSEADRDRAHVLTVARLVPKKGIPYLLEAYAKLRDRRLEFTAEIVGSDPLDMNYEELRDDLGLGDRVTFTGSVPFDSVKRKMVDADLFALPSVIPGEGDRENDRDGLPNVLLEASLAQLPVVSTTISGIPEGVRDGETGLLVEPENSDQLADALEQLLRNPERRQTMGRNARDFVSEQFDCEKQARRLADVLHQLNERDS